MSRRKVCFIITTRGNYAKLKTVIKAIQGHEDVNVQIIVAGGALLNKYGRISEVVSREFNVDRFIPYIIEGGNLLAMAKSAGIAVSDFATAFADLNPDSVVLVGDRYETLAIAMAAAYMNIPIAHLEGGEVSGSIDESIRHAVTKMAHLHFPCCQQAAERIIRLGEPPETVFKVGATSLDAMLELDLLDLSPVIRTIKTKGVGPFVDIKNGYLMVLFHPVTTEYAHNLQPIEDLIKAVDVLAFPTIWIWPNMDAGSDIISQRIRVYREEKSPKHIHFLKSLPVELFGPALYNASCILGNSSSGIRESAFFGVPSVTIGSRQNGRDKGQNVISVLGGQNEILHATRKQLKKGKYPQDFLYGDGKTSTRIAHILSTSEFCIQKRITF